MGLAGVLRGLNVVKNARKTKKMTQESSEIALNGAEKPQEGQIFRPGEGVSLNGNDSVKRRQNGQNSELPVIKLGPEQLSRAWKVEKVTEKTENGENNLKFVVTGPKIEKFARRTDLDNYASVNRLRDILKKMGIRAELTSQGAVADSIISIAGKEFTLVEDY